MLRADRCSLILIILLPLTVAEAHAQRLLESDGIELRGTARIVTFGAGACSVVEDRETAAEYERKKANHGKPVDVWQLDFSVHNGSEQYLDHLIARYQIAAEWPPCTNWSGPSGTYAEQVQWGGAAGHIQESGRNVVSPGETKTATVFLVVFHEDEPRFENWSLDYEFGETAVATLGERPDMEQRRPEPRAEATAEATGADDSAGVGERGLPPGMALMRRALENRRVRPAGWNWQAIRAAICGIPICSQARPPHGTTGAVVALRRGWGSSNGPPMARSRYPKARWSMAKSTGHGSSAFRTDGSTGGRTSTATGMAAGSCSTRAER